MMAATDVAVIAGSVSTVVFVASYLPMLLKAVRSKDLSSYSASNLILANAGNVVHSVYVFSLPASSIRTAGTTRLSRSGRNTRSTTTVHRTGPSWARRCSAGRDGRPRRRVGPGAGQYRSRPAAAASAIAGVSRPGSSSVAGSSPVSRCACLTAPDRRRTPRRR